MHDEREFRGFAIPGEPRALEFLYTSCSVRLRQFLRRYVNDREMAEDVAQDSFLELWQRPASFNPARASLKTYLFGIARVKAAGWCRTNKRTYESPVDLHQESGETTALMRDALRRIDPALRKLLWLREVEGYSYEELARIFGVPLGTVRSRLHTAREQLRRVWKQSV